MKIKYPVHMFKWTVGVLVTLTMIIMMYFPFKKGVVLNTEEDFTQQNFGVIAERWIVVDGTEISNDDMLRLNDVPEWRILVFGGHITRFKRRRCTNCIFTKDIITKKPSHATNIKMAAFVHAISHGAAWIYITNKIVNLTEQVEGFHFGETEKGLLFQGQAVFDSDQHFGSKYVSEDPTTRQKNNSYLLGEYMTPSVQSKWKPPRYIWESTHADKDNTACRLPHVAVPAHLLPPMNLMGSLIGYRSFWVLGSLITEGKSLVGWWLQLMNHIKETIGIYPPSCDNMSLFKDDEVICARTTKTGSLCGSGTNDLTTIHCSQGESFFTCGIYLAQAMAERGFLHQSDVVLLKSWFHTLVTLHYQQPLRETSQKKQSNVQKSFKSVVFDSGDVSSPKNETSGNPFHSICKSESLQNIASNFKDASSSFPINDILLTVIFNSPILYPNVIYLDYIHRKYFTNILYCGSSMDTFKVFLRNYTRPVKFLEVKEIGGGYHGYLCAAYAMEMGYKVRGYLQISDDVMLNTWNIADLPRDKMWFQHSIRNGSIMDPNVTNITPLVAEKTWWPWSSYWGVERLREIFKDINLLKKTPERLRAVAFFKQLEINLGGKSGGFYEASDIFYVPNKYKDNFNFFSKICIKHQLFLEIAIPTMLCGFDDIDNIVRLKGKYMWAGERGEYTKFFNPKNQFIHPWKIKLLLTQVQGKEFFCTKYFPYIE